MVVQADWRMEGCESVLHGIKGGVIAEAGSAFGVDLRSAGFLGDGKP